MVGGAAIGAAGQGGTIYQGYTLSWGDEFATLDIVGPAAPRGKYFTTRGAYSGTGPRGSDTVLAPMYNTDPLHTGHNDANRGVAYVADTMAVSSSVLTLAARHATAGEKTKFEGTGRYVAASMITSVGACSFHPDTQGAGDIIVEARIKHSTTNPAGWHPTFWTFSDAPAQVAASAAQSADEHDFEGTNTVANLHHNLWDVGGPITSQDATNFTYDAAFHTWTYLLSKSATDGVKLYKDGVLFATGAYSANTKDKIMQALLTCHADTGGTEAGWTADGDGAQMQVDWWRAWRRTGKSHYRPLASVSDTNVAFNAATTITLPSAATIWGDGTVTEYLQCVLGEENEPGSSHATGYVQFPTGVTYDSGTRVITITTALTGTKAGRLNFVLYGYKAGCTAEPLRFALNVGPSINVASIPCSVGTAGTYDLYAAIDCGVLVSNSSGLKAKTISVTGMPSGVSYDDTTGLLSWTTGVTAATTAITINVTNSIGQTASKSVNFTATSGATGYTGWTGPGWFDASDSSTYVLSGSNVTSLANKRAGGGDLTAGGTAGTVTKVAAGRNGLDIIRVNRDLSGASVVNSPRLVASTAALVSTAFQGNDQPYTVIVAFKPTDTNTGFIWSASDSGNGTTTAKNIALVRRSASASSIRRAQSDTTANDVSWGSGEASGTPRIVAVRHTGTVVTVWDNSISAKAVDAVSQDATDMLTSLRFILFQAESAYTTGSDPVYHAVQCSMDFFECVVENNATHSDSEITTAMTDMATKWGITLS